MPDRSFLDWPFLDDGHRRLAAGLEAWAGPALAGLDHADLDAACRGLVRRLASGGWLAFAVPGSAGGAREQLDVRSLCLIRETLARHDGLADFAFAMQGLGSAAIHLFGDPGLQQDYLPAVREGRKIAGFA